MAEYPRQAWHLCDLLDGHNRPFRTVKEITLVSPCPNKLKGCYVDDRGLHVQQAHLHPSAAAVPPPAFDHYYSFKEGPMDTAKIRSMTLASLCRISPAPPNMVINYVPLSESESGVTVTFPKAPEDVQEVHAMVRRPNPCLGLEGHDEPYSDFPHVYYRDKDTGVFQPMDLPVTLSPESEEDLIKGLDSFIRRFYMVGDVNAMAGEGDSGWTDEKGNPVSTKDAPTRTGPTCYLILLSINFKIVGLAVVSQKPTFHDRKES